MQPVQKIQMIFIAFMTVTPSGGRDHLQSATPPAVGKRVLGSAGTLRMI
jgi:hypothetical protein